MKITTTQMEVTLAKYFDFTRNIIVPSVRWGLSIHECDLLIMTKSGYLYEVEIKITKQDLLADLKKKHKHKDKRIKHLYFAIPEKLKNCIEFIPKKAGIILVKYRKRGVYYNGKSYKGFHYCEEIRKPNVLSDYKCGKAERIKLLRLGSLRIWSLKNRIIKLKKDKENENMGRSKTRIRSPRRN